MRGLQLRKQHIGPAPLAGIQMVEEGDGWMQTWPGGRGEPDVSLIGYSSALCLKVLSESDDKQQGLSCTYGVACPLTALLL